MDLYYITGTDIVYNLGPGLLLLMAISCYIPVYFDFPLKGWKKQNGNTLDIVMKDRFKSSTLTCSLGTTYSLLGLDLYVTI